MDEVTAISSGIGHSLAVVDGRVFSWGFDYSTGDFGGMNVPAEAMSGVTQVSAGKFHSLALKNGQVIQWGVARLGSPVGYSVPTELESGGVTDISAGWLHSLAIKDGRVYSWGEPRGFVTRLPSDVLEDVVQVEALPSGGLALKSDGKVIVWGDDRSPAWRIPPDAREGVDAIAAHADELGRDTVVLALKDGKVISWGSRLSRNNWQVPLEAQSGVTAIAVGETHALALRDGAVISWGAAKHTAVPGLARSGVTAIAAGSGMSLVIRPQMDEEDFQEPSAVTRLKLKVRGGFAVVKWSPPWNFGGPESVRYQFRYGATWIDTDQTEARFRIRKGRTVKVQVRAITEAGAGPHTTVRKRVK